MQGAESSEQCNKNELILAPPQKNKNVWFKESLSADCACGTARTHQSNIGQAHANLKRLLAACPLRATSGHSQGDKPSAETLVPSETRKVSAFKSPLCKNRVRTRLPPWQRSADRTRLASVYREFPSLGATAST